MGQASISPLTGILEEDKVIIDFGEHEGKSVLEVSENYPDFYQLMIDKKEVCDLAIKRSKDKMYRLYMNHLQM